jgi:hypothetical protein
VETLADRFSAIGTSRHFAAARQSRCFRAEADIGLDFMSTRPSLGQRSRGCVWWRNVPRDNLERVGLGGRGAVRQETLALPCSFDR